MLPRGDFATVPVIYLSLGSNLGDRWAHLKTAAEDLKRTGIRVRRESLIYKTAPQDVTDQPAFLNQVLECEATASAEEMLRLIQQVEQQGGRDREGVVRRGPREIDVDLLLYGDLILSSESLTVPHPRMLDRLFVMRPLAELNPNLIHPQTGRSITSYLAALAEQEVQVFNPH